MQVEPNLTFEELIGKLILNDALCDQFLSEADAVAAESTGLRVDDIARLRALLCRVRSGEPAMAAIVNRVLRAANRTVQY